MQRSAARCRCARCARGRAGCAAAWRAACRAASGRPGRCRPVTFSRASTRGSRLPLTSARGLGSEAIGSLSSHGARRRPRSRRRSCRSRCSGRGCRRCRGGSRPRVGAGFLVEQRRGGQHDARDAEAALRAAAVDERLLERVQRRRRRPAPSMVTMSRPGASSASIRQARPARRPAGRCRRRSCRCRSLPWCR